ncbi:MAG: phosphate ABC transporter permease subunit PstC [Lachnospiraceae bacterium]|nr:phosphate ABC transporter permease subunit PstC [Lachnospiraceae bacterium]
MNHMKEKGMRLVFLIAACVSILAVALICVFLFANGIPAIGKIGPLKFLRGETWRPSNEIFGIFPMIMGSIYVTAGAILIGVPIAILTSVFLAKYCPKQIYRPLKSATELMAGVPSIVYGFFGLVLIVPMVRDFSHFLVEVTGNKHLNSNGSSMLTASILLGIMILPTIIGVTESAIRSIPESYYEGSLALGATHERTIFRVILPAAKSGILAGVVLGIGRAIGETMAVIMVAGNQARMPDGLLKGVRTMTANIVIEMGYATDLHREALIATGVVLFVFILIINLCLSVLNRRSDNGN